jgi:cyclophilin family peptidyl-prolyl cis-trans isomerase
MRRSTRFVVPVFVLAMGVSVGACSSKAKVAKAVKDVQVASTENIDVMAPSDSASVDSGLAYPASDASATDGSNGSAVETTAASSETAAPAKAGDCPSTDGSAPTKRKFAAAPPMCIDKAKKYQAVVETSEGSMTFDLDPVKAPITTNSFVFLARQHYFEGIKFHRVVPNFVLQAGDPFSIDDSGPVGTGGPGYEFNDELPEPGTYKIGSLVMANAGPNTNGSQFFVVSGSGGTALPPNYAMFGQLADGQKTIDAIGALGVGDGPPSKPVTITSVTIKES